jgi:hypothetical protein
MKHLQAVDLTQPLVPSVQFPGIDADPVRGEK